MKCVNSKPRKNCVNILLLIICLLAIDFLERACCGKFVIKPAEATAEVLFRWDCFTIGGAIALTLLQYIFFDRRSDVEKYLWIMLYVTATFAFGVICLLLCAILFLYLNVPTSETIALFVVQFILLTARILALARYKKRQRRKTGDCSLS